MLLRLRNPAYNIVLVNNLCRLSSSAPVERIFSAGGLIMRPHRARLSCNMLKMLVYLKCNFNFWKNKNLMSLIKLNYFTNNILVSISVSISIVVSVSVSVSNHGLSTTSLEARQTLVCRWKIMTVTELKKVVGILFLIGVYKSNHKNISH